MELQEDVQRGEEFRVESARDALALLSRKAYETFGNQALLLIKEVCYGLGYSVGKKMGRNLSADDLRTVGMAFAQGVKGRGNSVDILELSDNNFHLKGYHCNLGLKGTNRELCLAMMELDRGIFVGATGNQIDLDITKTLAANDDCCEMIYRLRE